MKFEYRYHGSSAVQSSPGSTGLTFAPDTLRQPTFFDGVLRQKLPFREAMSALHDVVVSDYRFQPKDKSEYKAWAQEQELIELGELTAEQRDVGERFTELSAKLRKLRGQRSEILRPYYKAQREYFNHLYKTNKTYWFILDPVITVHPDEIFFECFSRDESTYGRLGCKHDVFQSLGDFSCGTTNVDYSDALYQEFQKIRGYKDTRLKVDPSGFEVQTTQEESHKEVKIDLPDSWVRGFLQVSSAMTLPTRRVHLHPMDVHNICFLLRRRKERKGPRSLRFFLEPGKPVRILFEPWNHELVCPRSVYEGDEADEIRMWGRRRLHMLERVIPVADRFVLHLLGTGLPSFWIADIGDLRFTLGLSGWTANDWSRVGNFDLMAPRATVDEVTQRRVFDGLKENWFEDPTALAERLGLDRSLVLGALSAYTQAGRAIYDLDAGVYRLRELSREPLPMNKLRFANEREAAARRLLQNVRPEVSTGEDGRVTLTAEIQGRKKTQRHKTYSVHMVLDGDQRMVEGKCSCDFYIHNRLYKGPCEHMLALRMAHNEKTWRPKWFE